MKSLSKIFITISFAALTLGQTAIADGYEPLKEKKLLQKSELNLGIELASVQVGSETFSGSGIRAGYHFNHNEKYTTEIEVAQVFVLSGSSVSSLYTRVGVAVDYVISGRSLKSSRQILLGDNKKILEEKNLSSGNYFTAGLGFSQFFLAGARGNYPGTGLLIAGKYHFHAFDQDLIASLKTGRLTTSASTSLPIILGIEIPFSL